MIFYVDKFEGVENHFYVIESSRINSNTKKKKSRVMVSKITNCSLI